MEKRSPERLHKTGGLSTHSARLHSLTFSEEENKLSMFTHADE